jgi:hypothetical protein
MTLLEYDGQSSVAFLALPDSMEVSALLQVPEVTRALCLAEGAGANMQHFGT